MHWMKNIEILIYIKSSRKKLGCVFLIRLRPCGTGDYSPRNELDIPLKLLQTGRIRAARKTKKWVCEHKKIYIPSEEKEDEEEEDGKEGTESFFLAAAEQTSFLVYKHVVYKEVATLLK